MAVHIDTGTMLGPVEYKSYNMNHLGLVAGMYDELGIGTLLDKIIIQDIGQRNVSVGQIVKAMIINGLGFANRSLYLVSHFFQDKPIECLIGKGVLAEHLNDDVLGRALDAIYASGVTETYSQISVQAVKQL
jgi:transposase